MGWSASALLTGRKLKQLEVPGWSIAVAAVGGIVGMFLIPVVGIFVGFAVGLLVIEALRHGDLRHAFHSSLQTLKAMGTGVIVEFLLICVAASVWTVGVIVHFCDSLTRTSAGRAVRHNALSDGGRASGNSKGVRQRRPR